VEVRPEVLATGYQLVEGPRADGEGGVYFTDALGGGVYRWSDDGIDTIVPKRRGVGGLALHADGGVVVSGRDVTHVAPDGTNRLLFAAPEGVTGFNDICATSDGSILAGGLRFLPFTGEDPVPGAFWHVSAPEQANVVLENVEWPNGVGDAGDGTLCFCDYSRGQVTMVGGDHPRVVITPSGEADGLAFDIDGGVWVAQPRAQSLVRIILEDGTFDRSIELAGVQPASLAFDGDVLYVTTIANETRSGELLRMDAPIPGRRHHHATI
jgi:sugar lactone lactonase YvrE